MRYYLYKFSDNWADEMDVEGFIILTELEKDAALAKIKKQYKKGGTISFGSNEYNDYDSLEDVMACVEIKEISQSQYATIKSLFGDSFGETGPINSYDVDFDCDEDDEEPSTCDECGDDLEDGDDNLCYSCQAELEEQQDEQAYKQAVQPIVDFIKSEYGLEEDGFGNGIAGFKWRPTIKTELLIEIGEYSGSDDEEVEITLKLNNREVGYESFNVEEVSVNPRHYLKQTITQFIEKAKKY